MRQQLGQGPGCRVVGESLGPGWKCVGQLGLGTRDQKATSSYLPLRAPGTRGSSKHHLTAQRGGTSSWVGLRS